MNFSVSEKERLQIERWAEEHQSNNEDHLVRLAILGIPEQDVRLSYLFEPTGIGTTITIQCVCGLTEDVTDYDSW